jgi:hypothetical protein
LSSVGGSRDFSQDSSMNKKPGNLNPITSNGLKLVKPQELSLDLIMPSAIKGVKQPPYLASISPQTTQNQTSNAGGAGVSGNSVTSILQNMRTP